nr:MAG TPA: holin [Caudoviricetes sp.]DAS57700.1 MAG TPA: holin [Caudoviricetes sp.]
MFKFFSPEEAYETATLMAVALLIVLAAVIIDTITGIMRAMRTKQKIQSSIARRVFGKLIRYYLVIAMFTFIDVLLFIIDFEVRISIPELPYLTVLASIGAVATEGWSVWENLPKHDTTSIKNSAKQTQELAKELAKALNEVRNLAKTE